MGGLRLPPFIGIIRHLGYPAYFMTILGAWYVLAGVALLAPRFPRVKEWAYAGLVFNYTGAAASHLAVGDGAGALAGPSVFLGLVVASWALRPPSRREVAPGSGAAASTRTRTIVYWVATLIAVSEMALGGAWDLLKISYVRTVIEHLGYPTYFLLILGAWKVPGAVALLVPRFPRLKEWAYAGAFFNYTGAVASHLAVGDGADHIAPPLVFAAVTLASWALRPPDRRDLASPVTQTPANQG